MLAVSCSSGSRFVCHRAKPAITRDMHNRIRPAPGPGADNDSADVDTDGLNTDEDDPDEDDAARDDPDEERCPAPDNSSQIRAAAAGRMRSRCVYSSSCVASQSASRKGRHAATREMPHKRRNTDFGERLIIASECDEPTCDRPHIHACPRSQATRSKRRILAPQRIAQCSSFFSDIS